MTMRYERLFRSRTFRITLIYLSFITFALIALLGAVYWSTTAAVSRQIESTIDAELRGLSEQFNQLGLIGLIRAIERRAARNDDGRALYLLTDSGGRPLAGNLDRWPDGGPDENGWVTFRMESPQSARGFDFGRARVFDLRGGFRLLVGHDVREETFVAGLIRGTLIWAVLIVVVATLLGGFFLSRSLLSRIESVNAISQEIMAGNFSRRLPQAGSDDEFDNLARNLNAMLDQIERLIGGMRQVSDNIAHDLRSPLARLRSRLELSLLEPKEAEEYKDLIKETIEETDHLLQTFNALLSIAEAEAGAARERFEPVDLSSLVEDLADLYGPLAEDAGLSLDYRMGPGDPETIMAMGDRNLLLQAMANLIENAIKFSPEGGKILLSASTTALAAELMVADEGPGIPVKDRGRVLERFTRLEASRTTKGSGLGLALVSAVARL
ncbi:MAG: ATP-binding protein, partial [Kiloniellales bacterium]|nr:ATP-binding protein [Kiloniellales bacterium]